MLFPEEDVPLLKTWIVKRIENTSDADSDVLADYVIALLKHDGDKAAVRELCEKEIPDFLEEETKPFLDDVFQTIAYKAYMPGAPPAPKIDESNATQPATFTPAAPEQSNSRKRGFDTTDNGDINMQGDAPHTTTDRPMKQARRGGRNNQQQRGGYNAGGPGPIPQFDPSNPLEAFMQIQAMGMQLPGMAEFMAQQVAGPGPRQRRRGRCRDFDIKGYCSRGSTCMFDHGNDSIYMPTFSGPNNDDYDPNDARMPMPQMFNPMPNFAPTHEGGRGGRRKKGRNGKNGANRAAFSLEGPVHDRTKSTIVVENIPEESFTEDGVREYFQQFGTIMDVSLRPYKRLAILKFDQWDSANAAYQSPKAIFDNRFVKVFWFNENEGERSTGKKSRNVPSTKNPEDTEMDTETQEEFQRRQDEAQKIHEDRAAKKSEIEKQKLELEKKQQELLTRHREENERLRAKLGKSSSTPTDGGDGSNGADGTTDALRIKLAELEQEAKILGIDTSANDDGSSSGFRGGYRGRGGGGYRGRPRGRGSFRGTGRHATYAQYSLDNRPKKVTLSGVDFTAPEKDEALRHFLLNTGDFDSVETGTDVTHVSFKDRKTAEKFYYSLHGQGLPGLEANLELSWANSSTSGTAGSAPAAGVMDKAGEVDILDATVEGDSNDVDSRQQQNQDEVDMDYEMPGEEHW